MEANRGPDEPDVSEVGDGEFLESPQVHLAQPTLWGTLTQSSPAFPCSSLEIGASFPTKAAHSW